MLGNKKPKFKLTFAINDLSKIPHTSGYCYAELSIADGSPTGFRATMSHLKPFSSSSKDSSENELLPDSSGGHTSGSDNVAGHISSRCNQVRTSKYRIHNFKCHFNFTMSCNLKFPLKRKDNMIGDKYLVIRVFYNTDKHSKHDHPVELGVVKLNLSEYLNFNEPVTAKYLLQESKINSILNLTTSLEELPADFDFHTQLRIDDTKHNLSNQNSSLNISKASENGSKSFKVPHFQRQAVFGGIDGVINPSSNKDTDGDRPDHPTDSASEAQEEDISDRKDSSSQNRHMTTVGTKPIEDVIVDPIIGSLYRKILESNWDPDLHVLLKLTPQKVVDDIFDQSHDASGMEKNLQHYSNLRPQEDDDGVKNADGLIVESKFRDNLTSWSVSWT
ncbi:hypothetical protein JCM33374_g5836 [Metschnikowia sp. JCM 33374]|nr:hypothetical protein JCM33374_g5836 [Metschnikowia sp. JCM 33374]